MSQTTPRTPAFRTYHEVDGADRSALAAQVGAQHARVAARLATVERVVAVLSGKGGVGKSHVAAALAVAAAGALPTGCGVLDADLASPTVARLLDAQGPLAVHGNAVIPATGYAGIRVVSTDLLLDEGAAMRWREPSEARFAWRAALANSVLREFLGDVEWGALGLLVVDLPPGADGIADLHSLVPGLAGAVVVTLPSEESQRSVARTMRAARDAGVTLLGVLENMSGYLCPCCGETRPLFAGDAGATLAAEFAVPMLGRVPFCAASVANPPGSAQTPPRLPAAVIARLLEALA